MKAIYSSCAVGLNNGKVLDGDVIDEVAQETIGAILSKFQEEHQTYEVVSLILETAAEQLKCVKLQWDE